MTSDFAYSVEREFDIPVDILWAAWTDPIALEAWYHGVGHSVVPGSVNSVPEVGGLWTVAIEVPELDFVAYFYGKYTAVVENARIEHTLHFTDSAAEFALRDFNTEHHQILIEFESRDFRSWVKFSQFGDLSESDAIEAQAGIESYFDSLENYLTVPE
jgi:uncharacterized protein YndB with AHSA1/START domain